MRMEAEIGQDFTRKSPAYNFANVEPNKILEENLILSNDGSEVVFLVAEELQQHYYNQYISLDLKTEQLKRWSKDFEENILMKNPYNQVQKNASKDGISSQ